jgi:hypothetical protein
MTQPFLNPGVVADSSSTAFAAVSMGTCVAVRQMRLPSGDTGGIMKLTADDLRSQ